MKKLIFIGLGALLAFALVTCDSIQDGNTVLGTTNVEYSADGKRVTLYLEGGVPVTKASRALTSDLAKTGHDFFEVVLLADAGALGNITRASWEIGEAAGVKNVIRNVDYNTSDPSLANGADGAAILFVGRKSDKTLLAIGLLASVDDNPGTTLISTATTKVTFEVAALQAGASFSNHTVTTGVPPATVTTDVTPARYPAYTSFRTGTLTDIKTANVDGKLFPAYVFPIGTTTATYTLATTDIDDGTTPWDGTDANKTDVLDDTDNINAYLTGVMIAADPVAEFRIPRFPIPGNQYKEIRAPWANKTTVAFTNNTTADDPLASPIQFDVTTLAGNDGFVSLIFSIPVYAINKTPTADNVNPITWYIKPGFGTNYYDLDDGKGGAGAALLLAIGDVQYDYIEIVVVNK